MDSTLQSGLHPNVRDGTPRNFDPDTQAGPQENARSMLSCSDMLFDASEVAENEAQKLPMFLMSIITLHAQ